MPEIDFINSAQDCILEHGFHLPNTPITTGKVIRFSTGDTPDSDVNGWGYFNINPDGSYFGKIGDHVTKQEYTFFQGNQKSLTQKERKEIDAAIKKEQAKREAKQAQAIKEVRQMLSRAQPADRKHPYLAKKQVRPYGLLQINNALIVPMQDIYGNIMSAQTITPDGKKKFYPGCPIKGGSFIIGDITPGCIIAIVEGFATGATIHKILGIPVVVAFSSGNLLAVAQQLKEKHPDNDRVLFADNDLETAEKTKTGKNPGKEAAEEAARLTGARVCLCPVNSDFNDLFIAEGADAVKEAFYGLEQQVHKIKIISMAGVLKENRQVEPIAQDFLNKGDPMLIHGSGGLGKSILTQQIVMELAMDRDPTSPRSLFDTFPIVGGAYQSLIIQSENTMVSANIRARRTYNNTEAANRVFFPKINDDILTTGKSLGDPDSIQWIIDHIRAIEDHTNKEVSILLIDPLISFHDGDENDAKDMRSALDGITEIAQKTGVTPIVVHHDNRLNEVRGSGAINDWARSRVHLKASSIAKESTTLKDGHEPFSCIQKVSTVTMIHEKSNNTKMFAPITLQLNRDLQFEKIDKPLEPEVLERCSNVQQALKDLGGRTDSNIALATQVSELTGAGKTTCKKHIAEAVKHGFIKSEPAKAGDKKANAYRYFLPENQ